MAPIERATLRPSVYYEFLQGHSAIAAADNICAAFKGNVVHYSTGLGRSAYPDSSWFRKLFWFLVFLAVSGYTISQIIDTTKMYMAGPTTTMTKEGLHLVLTTYAPNNVLLLSPADGFRLTVHPIESDPNSLGEGFDVNLQMVSNVVIAKMEFERLHPEDCALDTFLMQSENLAVVNVYYETMAVEKTVESALYPWTSFIGTLGGLLGLYTGVSFLSILEMLEWILDLILYGWRKPRHGRMGPKRLVIITLRDRPEMDGKSGMKEAEKAGLTWEDPPIYNPPNFEETWKAALDLAHSRKFVKTHRSSYP
ncbi:unnamed protein product [Darwinula stevensoni]|uniref:Mos1 transposase HTH domain-containing protein n=1 Tax=Darwinula stevensoni TaxID=69355 RepID=A0A7R9AB97_9CRUS|nr:unnamed protein product [Darwinula stevensoni]CAG0899083.1 unnamed protein product [Darwinula stevensoni]